MKTKTVRRLAGWFTAGFFVVSIILTGRLEANSITIAEAWRWMFADIILAGAGVGLYFLAEHMKEVRHEH